MWYSFWEWMSENYSEWGKWAKSLTSTTLIIRIVEIDTYHFFDFQVWEHWVTSLNPNQNSWAQRRPSGGLLEKGTLVKAWPGKEECGRSVYIALVLVLILYLVIIFDLQNFRKITQKIPICPSFRFARVKILHNDSIFLKSKNQHLSIIIN